MRQGVSDDSAIDGQSRSPQGIVNRPITNQLEIDGEGQPEEIQPLWNPVLNQRDKA
jgi:hypothetical protein